MSGDLSIAILAGFLDGIESRGSSFDATQKSSWGNGSPDPQRAAAIERIVHRAGELVASSDAPLDDRLRSLRVLTIAPPQQAFTTWIELLAPQQPEDIRANAARWLGRTADAPAVEGALKQW